METTTDISSIVILVCLVAIIVQAIRKKPVKPLILIMLGCFLVYMIIIIGIPTVKSITEQKVIEQEATEAIEVPITAYETGITYEQLARTPKDYEGQRVKFAGKVIQVMDGGKKIQLRIAVNSDYNNILFVYYASSIIDIRVLDDDMITLYGTSKGLQTYQSTLGGNITIPLIAIEKIEMQ